MAKKKKDLASDVFWLSFYLIVGGLCFTISMTRLYELDKKVWLELFAQLGLAIIAIGVAFWIYLEQKYQKKR